MGNPNTHPCIFINPDLFQHNAEGSTDCPNNAAVHNSVEKSYPRLNEETSSHSIKKLKGPPSFTDFVGDK